MEMYFGRRRRQPALPDKKGRGERAVACMCLLISCLVLGGAFFRPETKAYPLIKSEAAVATFREEYGTLAKLLGVDTYFPPAAQTVGSFSPRGEAAYRAYVEEREWRFFDYLRDAFRTLLERP